MVVSPNKPGTVHSSLRGNEHGWSSSAASPAGSSHIADEASQKLQSRRAFFQKKNVVYLIQKKRRK
jgi:hypothetical protein